MDISNYVKTEASFPIGKYYYDIVTMHHHGWFGDEKYDDERLEIVKHLKLPDGEKFPMTDSAYYDMERIERGEFDVFQKPPTDPSNTNHKFHYDMLGKDLTVYKEAILRFRKLEVLI